MYKIGNKHQPKCNLIIIYLGLVKKHNFGELFFHPFKKIMTRIKFGDRCHSYDIVSLSKDTQFHWIEFRTISKKYISCQFTE